MRYQGGTAHTAGRSCGCWRHPEPVLAKMYSSQAGTRPAPAPLVYCPARLCAMTTPPAAPHTPPFPLTMRSRPLSPRPGPASAGRAVGPTALLPCSPSQRYRPCRVINQCRHSLRHKFSRSIQVDLIVDVATCRSTSYCSSLLACRHRYRHVIASVLRGPHWATV